MSARDDERSAGLSRRELLGTAGAALGAGALAPLAAHAAPPAASVGEPSSATPAAPSFELAELTISELQRGLRDGRWTSERLVELYLARIASVDAGPSGLSSIAETNPDAPAIAASLDAERRAGKVRGPLHGIPVVIKDNIDSADQMKTTAGSLALAASRAPKDAFLVERLRAAGAVLLAKTNLSEWANFRSTRSTSGWSGRGGQVRNPYALDRNPCGSSSGTGAAVSANLAAAGVGTETDGSITCPSTFCGLVGLKPTVGRVSRSGIIPISASQDTAGPMTRTVTDAALLLEALLGTDLLDPATAAAAGKEEVRGAAPKLVPEALRGARLGVVRKLSGWHPDVDRQLEGVLDLLKSLGAVLVDPLEIPNLGKYDDVEYTVMLYEFKHGLNAYLAGLPANGQPRTLAELIAWNEAHAAQEMPWFGQEIFLAAEEKGPLTEPAYLEALATCRRLSREQGLDLAFSEQRLDALVCPTAGPAYLTDWINGDHYGGSATTPSAVSGYPHLTVPAGDVHGLPWGLSFLGPAWSETRLLRFGFAFEQASRARRAPELLPTLRL